MKNNENIASSEDVSPDGWARGAFRRRLFLAGLLLVSGAATAGNSVEFQATIVQKSCTIEFRDGATATSPVIPGAFQLLDADSSQLTRCVSGSQGCFGPTKPVTLTLKGCGLGQTGKTPKVTLMGTQAQPADVTGPNQFMLRDAGIAGGTSREYFVVVAGKAVPRWSGNPDLYGVGDVVLGSSVNEGSATTADSSGNGAFRTLYLGVSCGGFTNCNLPTRLAGSLTASLTFDFAYK